MGHFNRRQWDITIGAYIVGGKIDVATATSQGEVTYTTDTQKRCLAEQVLKALVLVESLNFFITHFAVGRT